jgi:exodeoxyribonuclease V alpha subunit
MVANAECSWLLSAIKPGTQVVFIGDDHQLPPVGKGKPFSDMIKSGVFPHAHLTEVHRYAGRIAHVCEAIRNRKKIVPSPALDLSLEAGEFGPENYRHIECPNSLEILQAMDELCGRMRDRGYDPVKDMQVIVTRNDKGGINRLKVNARLQQLLNPDGAQFSGCPFRIGDKVICKRNGNRDTYEIVTQGQMTARRM